LTLLRPGSSVAAARR